MGCWSEPTSKHAYILSWISVVTTVVAAIVGIVLFNVTGSSLALVYGLENCVDFFSSVVVLWRFFCPTLDEEVEKMLARREKRASISISFILGFLGVGILVAAGDDISRGEEEEVQTLGSVLAISFISVFIFGTLAMIKFRYSEKLDSPSLYKDGICSLIGTILSGALFASALIVKEDPGLWWIDPVVSIFCGIGAIIIGLHALYVALFRENLPIFSLSWWFFSQGDSPDGPPPSATEMTAGATTGGGQKSNVETSEII